MRTVTPSLVKRRAIRSILYRFQCPLRSRESFGSEWPTIFAALGR
jgi:hypothetical protein